MALAQQQHVGYIVDGGIGDEDEDDLRAADIDQLVENGNWDVSVVFDVFYL